MSWYMHGALQLLCNGIVRIQFLVLHGIMNWYRLGTRPVAVDKVDDYNSRLKMEH